MTSLRVSTPDDTTVVLTVPAAGSIADTYRLFTGADELARWYWPPRLEATYAVDAQVGGVWRVRSEVIEMGFTAVYGEVVPNRRLAMSWQWDADAAVSKVEIDFTTTDDGSSVTVTHSDNADVTVREEHRAGWSDCLARLCEQR